MELVHLCHDGRIIEERLESRTRTAVNPWKVAVDAMKERFGEEMNKHGYNTKRLYFMRHKEYDRVSKDLKACCHDVHKKLTLRLPSVARDFRSDANLRGRRLARTHG